ncbi:MAG: cupin domain-containing protein [Nitrosopumilus sp.]|nr:cupin domain-containing protein [Nitrosopumilus sp.]MDA7998798.1 cupin domain-containing protein [Nitrosopumilus sp.]
MRRAFDAAERASRLGGRSYFETFADIGGIAAGVLALDPGDEDTQEPHGEDEAYYIIEGDGYLRIGGRDYAVRPGMVFLVEAGREHRFHGNTRRLTAAYFFGG